MFEDRLKGVSLPTKTRHGDSPLKVRILVLAVGLALVNVLIAGARGALARQPIVIAWNDNSDNEAGFRIERSTDNIEFVEIATVGSDVTSYSDSVSLVAGQMYAYRVRAFNDYGVSGYTNTRTTYYSPIPEFYFGDLGEQGGSFAIMCRGDGSAIFFGTTESDASSTVVQEFQLEDGGTFEFLVPDLGTFTGLIENGLISGFVNAATVGEGGIAIASLDLMLNGAVAVANGGTAELAGFYDTGIDPATGARLLILAGPNGDGFVVSSTSSEVRGGKLQITTEAAGLAVLDDGTEVLLGFSKDERVVAGSVSRGGQSFEFLGRDESAQGRTEFLNASMRTTIDAGATIIMGFVVSGTGEKQLLIRGVGPTLAELGVDRPVVDPRIKLFRLGSDDALHGNDDWESSDGEEIERLSRLAGAFPLSETSKDAALVVDLPAGVYWLHMANPTPAAGTGLVEIYDLDALSELGTSSSLVNLSVRGRVDNESEPIIAGFVLSDRRVKGVMLRAMGSELAHLGVEQVLGDPVLKVFGSEGAASQVLAVNEDWENDAALLTELSEEVGAFDFQLGSRSAAKAMWLDGGVYTVVVNGREDHAGEVLVELYGIP